MKVEFCKYQKRMTFNTSAARIICSRVVNKQYVAFSLKLERFRGFPINNENILNNRIQTEILKKKHELIAD